MILQTEQWVSWPNPDRNQVLTSLLFFFNTRCELNTKIKSSTLNEVAKRVAVAELLVHKRRAKKFYNKFKEVCEICKNRSDVMAITFDYMQNLPLSFLPVQEMFYLRKL